MNNPDKVTYFAATNARGVSVPFGIKQEDRSKHMYVIGKTGMGKSTMLENMAIQDIRNGEGLAFIDPHGASAERILDYIPPERVNDVVYFAPFDLEQPIAFNIMEDIGYDKRHLVVSGLMATFKKVWIDAWSARMEYILSNTLLALLEYPGSTLLDVNRMYTNKEYRKQVVDNLKDPLVKDFWMKEFTNYTDRYTQEATPAIQNKIGQFTNNPLIRNIIGQKTSSFDIRDMMDKQKILIVNLSKGLVGDTNMLLLGSMLTTHIFLAAMSRADSRISVGKDVPPFFFYVDEFQNFATESFSEILSEARKYKLDLIIAHQYVEQMQEEVRAAVFGNVGTTIAFRVGPFDAEVLETIFMPEFTKEDLVNLGFAHIYLSLMIDGVGSRPFSAITIPPIEPPPRIYMQEVIQASRTQFGRPRKEVEDAIAAVLAGAGIPKSSESPRAPRELRASRSGRENKANAREARSPYDRGDARETRAMPARAHDSFVNPRNPFAKEKHNMPEDAMKEHGAYSAHNVHGERNVSRTKKDNVGASLRDVIASVTNVSREDEQRRRMQNQSTLKQTLSDVLENAGGRAGAPVAEGDRGTGVANTRAAGASISGGVTAKRAVPGNTTPKKEPHKDELAPKPFEISERKLKDILNGRS